MKTGHAFCSEIVGWLHHLYQILPAKGVILVGAGSENSSWVRLLNNLQVYDVILVEADQVKYQCLKKSLQLEGWQFSNTFITDTKEVVPFYKASYHMESGLLNPDNLRTVWPNINTHHKQEYQGTRLVELHSKTNIRANWLIVDCLPIIPILKGASNSIQEYDVIVIRTLLIDNEDVAKITSQEVADDFLTSKGYRCLAVESEHNPHIMHSLYIRDEQAIELREKLANTYKGKCFAEREGADSKNHLKSKRKENALLQKQFQEIQKDYIEIKEKLESSLSHNLSVEKNSVNLKKSLESFDKEKKLIQRQFQDSSEANRKLTKQLESTTQLLRESEYQQNLMDKELIKAGAQIDLIKDLLLREKSNE